MGGALSANCRLRGAPAGAPAPPPVAPGAPAPGRSAPSATLRPPRRGSGARQSGSAAIAAAFLSAAALGASGAAGSLSRPTSCVGLGVSSAKASDTPKPTQSVASAALGALERATLRSVPRRARPRRACCPHRYRFARSSLSSPPQSLRKNGSVPPFFYAALGPLVRQRFTGPCPHRRHKRKATRALRALCWQSPQPRPPKRPLNAALKLEV